MAAISEQEEFEFRRRAEQERSAVRPKSSRAMDMVKSGASGVMEGAAGMGDMAAQSVGGGQLVNMAVRGAGDLVRRARGVPVPQRNPFEMGAPGGVSDAYSQFSHKPETTAGEYARTAGQMAPNIFAPAKTIAARALNWAAPALASEGAAQVAKSAGAGEGGQGAARVVGALAGGAGASMRPNIYSSVKAAAPPRPAPRPKVNLDTLRDDKTAAYKAVDDMGVTYSQEAYGSLLDGLKNEMEGASIDAARHPKAFSMLQQLERTRGKAPSLTALDQIRQVIRRDVANAPDEAERFFGKKMIANVDEFIAAAGDQQVTQGSAKGAAAAVLKARDLNTRLSKAEDVVDATDRANLRASSTGTGGNEDNAVRQNLRRILETRRNLAPEERAALELAVKGGPVQNALRLVGRMSPTGGAVPLLANLGAAGVSGGKSLVLGAAGYGAKMAADRITRSNVESVLDVIVNGPKPEAASALEALKAAAQRDPSLREAYQQALVRAGVAGSVMLSPAAANAEERPRR